MVANTWLVAGYMMVRALVPAFVSILTCALKIGGGLGEGGFHAPRVRDRSCLVLTFAS